MIWNSVPGPEDKLTRILADIAYNSVTEPLTLKRYANSRTLTTRFGYNGADLVSVTDPLNRMTTMFPVSVRDLPA